MIDFHAHSYMSYCANMFMTPELYAAFLKSGRSPELEKIVIADHGMALYFPRETAWKFDFITNPSIFDQWRDWGNARLEMLFKHIAEYSDAGIVQGFEVELMNDGRYTLDQCMRKRIRILIGAVHFLPLNRKSCQSPDIITDAWKKHTFALINSDIDILAHPFRWLANQVPDIRPALIDEIVSEIAKAGKAIELNGHYIINTDVQMLRAAVEKGVKISFGTDSHAVHEIADFSYHLKTLELAGLKISDLNMLSI